MKVSIVTISYNQRRFIEETINSVINQTYPNIEYIVIDAGSTDGSREIINKYKSKINRIVFEPDNGQADGLNKGFGMATGEICCFINSDDILLPEAVTIAVGYFKMKTSADILLGNGYIIDQDSNILRKIYVDTFSLRKLAYGCFTFLQPSLFFKKEAFLEIGGFNEFNKTCWDGELLAEFSIRNKEIHTVPEFLSCFRYHANSITVSGKQNYLYEKDKKRIFSKLMSRDYQKFDILPLILYRLIKWFSNPFQLYESIRYSIALNVFRR